MKQRGATIINPNIIIPNIDSKQTKILEGSVGLKSPKPNVVSVTILK